MAHSLEGQIALVTGAGRGIGRAIALALAEAGANLILLARTASELDETAAQVHHLGREALSVVADVSVRQDVQRAVAQGLDKFGRVDVSTIVPDLLKGMIVHPYSKETVQTFL